MEFPDRTLVFGHRGASAYAPENTLAAFELAAEQGADGIELDVHLTADGYPVVIHDFTVEQTTSGSGAVVEKTLAQLKTLDAGSWFDEKFLGTRVPTLDEVFGAVGARLLVNIEIKADTRNIERVVAESITQYNMQDRVIISSFNPDVLRRFRSTMPEVAIGYLYMSGEDPRTALQELQCEAVHPYYEIIDTNYIEWAKSAGYAVNCWTVNDPARARELHRLGVNAIITDHPDTVIAALKNA